MDRKNLKYVLSCANQIDPQPFIKKNFKKEQTANKATPELLLKNFDKDCRNYLLLSNNKKTLNIEEKGKVKIIMSFLKSKSVGSIQTDNTNYNEKGYANLLIHEKDLYKK
ncbi:hypothetical protein ACTFIV_007875 [Dictyostelium citrinum]